MSDATADSAARRRIEQDLDTNLTVVAGAGTGKTTALVGRIVALVRSGSVSLHEIAAITFTEAAAAELRAQVRRAIDSGLADGDRRLDAARAEVDDAAICTLHSFAHRILLESCVEARLPPGFEVLDDTAEVADFEARWTRFADTLFDDPAAERALVLGLSAGLRHSDLATLAWDLHTQWDRLEDGGLEYLHAVRTCDDHWPATDPGLLIDALDRAANFLVWCTDDDDKMAHHLRTTVIDARSQLAAARSDTLGMLQLLVTLPPLRCAHGRQENWTGRITEVRAACAEAEQARTDLLDTVRRAALGDLVARVATFTLAAAEERRIEGRLTFHDLLVHARRLVRQRGDRLAALRQRYRRLLIDEFQDTDAIQVELAMALAGSIEATTDAGRPRPGGLFVVGDPKQSIYGFRRADIDLFEKVSTGVGPTAVLQTNFRSVPGIVEFVNVVFDEIFGRQSGPGQATHQQLHAARPAPTAEGTGRDASEASPTPSGGVQLTFDWPDSAGLRAPSPTRRVPVSTPSSRHAPGPVIALGGAVDVSTPEVRRRAAGDAATAIDHIVGHRWMVEDAEDGTRRPARWRDIAVLIPARSCLPALQEALENAGVPYRLEGAALLWGAEEVREVLAVLRAVDDPADAVAVLGALRSAGLACGDDDLVTWHGAGGTWDPGAPVPSGLESHPVAQAMAVLENLRRRRWWSEPSVMVAAACDELGSFELALSHRRPRDHWHRLRWLQDQARLFDESPGGTLRAFLTWADLRARGDGREGGVGPPDPDDDAVRIMTIHGAKGLAFPVVVLAGLERDQSDGPRPPSVLWTDRHIPEVHVGDFRTAGYEQAGLRAQHLDVLEQHRLLYVAMTRARDHLVVCLHHKQRTGGTDSSLAASVTRICVEHPTLWRRLPDGASTNGTPRGTRRDGDDDRDDRPTGSWTPGSPGPGAGVALPARWEADRTRLLATLRRRPVTTATAVADHATGGARRACVPGDPGGPESRILDRHDGDVARRVGRAVHAALADLDLSTRCDAAGRPADQVARIRAAQSGVAAGASDVAAMVRRALASPTVARAADRRHWREVYVTAPAGHGGVVEGYVDLLVDDDDGLVVVDYKTDRIGGAQPRSDPLAGYRLQVAAYATALESSTGLTVHRCVLIFVGDGAPSEHVLEGVDLAAARAQAAQVVDALLTT